MDHHLSGRHDPVTILITPQVQPVAERDSPTTAKDAPGQIKTMCPMLPRSLTLLDGPEQDGFWRRPTPSF